MGKVATVEKNKSVIVHHLCNQKQTVRIVYSNAYDTSLRYFVRGGNWTNISYAGVLALFLNYSNPDPAVGFRVTR